MEIGLFEASRRTVSLSSISLRNPQLTLWCGDQCSVEAIPSVTVDSVDFLFFLGLLWLFETLIAKLGSITCLPHGWAWWIRLIKLIKKKKKKNLYLLCELWGTVKWAENFASLSSKMCLRCSGEGREFSARTVRTDLLEGQRRVCWRTHTLAHTHSSRLQAVCGWAEPRCSELRKKCVTPCEVWLVAGGQVGRWAWVEVGGGNAFDSTPVQQQANCSDTPPSASCPPPPFILLLRSLSLPLNPALALLKPAHNRPAVYTRTLSVHVLGRLWFCFVFSPPLEQCGERTRRHCLWKTLNLQKTALQEFRKAALRARSRVPQFMVMSLVWGISDMSTRNLRKTTEKSKKC